MSETIRVASLVGQCSECPHRRYSGSGKHDCAKVQAPIVDAARIPAWCPLPGYPAQIAASALAALADAKRIMATAAAGANDASDDRLRDLIRIAAEQLARVE